MRHFEDFPVEEATSQAFGERPAAIHSAPEQLRLVRDPRSHVMTGAPTSNIVARDRQTEADAAMGPARESDFWASGPRYSRPSASPEIALSLPPRPKPSLLRRVLTKLLFATLFSAALALLAYEASIVYGFSWTALLRAE